MWDALEQQLGNFFALVLPALASFLVAWLRARKQQLIVKSATEEVETESQRVPSVNGESKKKRAIEKVRGRENLITSMSGEKLSALIEEVLEREQHGTASNDGRAQDEGDRNEEVPK